MDFEKVKEIIVDSLSCDESQVTMEANLKDDLEADSLDAVELIMQIEEEFEVEIPDEVASNMKTVKDIVDYIEANNGSNEDYFKAYKGGTVSIVDNSTGETVFETEIK